MKRLCSVEDLYFAVVAISIGVGFIHGAGYGWLGFGVGLGIVWLIDLVVNSTTKQS